MKKIIISIFIMFSFLTYSESNIQTLVSSDINLSNEYIEKNNLEIEKIVEVEQSNILKEKISKTIDKLSGITQMLSVEEFTGKISDLFINEIKMELVNISYILNNRVDANFKVKLLDIDDMFNTLPMFKNEEEFLKESEKRLYEKYSKKFIEDLEKSNLTYEEKEKKVMKIILDIMIDILKDGIKEYKKNAKYNYEDISITFVKNKNKWEKVDILGNEKSNLGFKVLVNKDINLSDEYIEKTQNEVFSTITQDIIIDKNENEKTIMEEYNFTEEEYNKYLSKDIEKMLESIDYTKKSIYFINENNVSVKYEIKVLDFFSSIENLLSDREFLIGILNIKNNETQDKESRLKKVVYVVKHLYGEKNIEKLKKENKYIYSNNLIKLEKINGTWKIKK